MAKITFLSCDMHIETPSGSALKDVYEKNPSLPLKFGCRRGECGVCSIEITCGLDNLTKRSRLEEHTLKCKGLTAKNHRLACQCDLNGDIVIK